MRSAGRVCPRAQVELREQIGDDVVVVACVERNLAAAPGLGYCAHDIQRLVAVERRDLDRHHIRDFDEFAPEGIGQHLPAHRRLQIEADDGDHFGDAAAVVQKLGGGGLRQGAQAEQPGVVAERQGQFRFTHGLMRIAHNARHLDEGTRRVPQMPINRCRGQRQHRFEQTKLGLMKFKLGRMHAHGDAARAGRAVVAGEGALPPLVQLEVGCEGERMGRNHLPILQVLSQFMQGLRHQKPPSRVSKWVGLSNMAPSLCTQAAIHWSICCKETLG